MDRTSAGNLLDDFAPLLIPTQPVLIEVLALYAATVTPWEWRSTAYPLILAVIVSGSITLVITAMQLTFEQAVGNCVALVLQAAFMLLAQLNKLDGERKAFKARLAHEARQLNEVQAEAVQEVEAIRQALLGGT